MNLEAMDLVAIFATKFLKFATKSLAEFYTIKGSDLALTIKMLTKLKVCNNF